MGHPDQGGNSPPNIALQRTPSARAGAYLVSPPGLGAAEGHRWAVIDEKENKGKASSVGKAARARAVTGGGSEERRNGASLVEGSSRPKYARPAAAGRERRNGASPWEGSSRPKYARPAAATREWASGALRRHTSHNHILLVALPSPCCGRPLLVALPAQQPHATDAFGRSWCEFDRLVWPRRR